MTYLRSFLVVAFMWVVLIGKGQAAVTLSFADPLTTWTAGSLSQTYTDVDGSGVDIVISITGDTGNFAAGFPALDMNAVGSPDDREALWFRIDSHATLAESIDISVDFLLTGTSDAASVTGVEATLLDIDYQEILAFGFPVSVFRDDIRNIEGDLVGGGTAPATATAISGTPSFAIVNDGASNMRLVGNEDSEQSPTAGFESGDATILFGEAVVEGFSYTYGNEGPLTGDDPTLQYTALGSVTFTTVVPEPSTAVLAVLGLALLVVRRSRPKACG